MLQYDLEHRLAIFVSDEMQFWHASRKVLKPTDSQLREITLQSVDNICRRAKLLSCKMEREKVSLQTRTRWHLLIDPSILQVPIGATPVSQALLDLVSHATNPLRLAAMDPSLLPWL